MNSKYTNNPEQYAAFFFAENKITHPGFEYVIHLAEPRCFIKFQLAGSFSNYKQFFSSIAEVQWLDGPASAPTGKALEAFLSSAWNYLAIEERILEDDLDNMNDDDDKDF